MCFVEKSGVLLGVSKFGEVIQREEGKGQYE